MEQNLLQLLKSKLVVPECVTTMVGNRIKPCVRVSTKQTIQCIAVHRCI